MAAPAVARPATRSSVPMVDQPNTAPSSMIAAKTRAKGRASPSKRMVVSSMP
jgi:hypothetical protein